MRNWLFKLSLRRNAACSPELLLGERKSVAESLPVCQIFVSVDCQIFEFPANTHLRNYDFVKYPQSFIVV